MSERETRMSDTVVLINGIVLGVVLTLIANIYLLESAMIVSRAQPEVGIIAFGHAYESIPIKVMTPGQQGYMVPWGLAKDSQGRFWANSNYTVSGDPGDTSNVLIEKGVDCITVLDTGGKLFDMHGGKENEWHDMKECGR